ncbi:MAG: endolytic transglycosylase MltG [Alphaproteobacteria bacterium]|nr:endolytic transglycosylase MltG [Alphaproteobacteria bacterium]
MRILASLFCLILALVGFAVGGVGYGWLLFTGPGPSPREVQLVIPRGASTTSVIRQLGEAGVIADPELVRQLATHLRQRRALRAGEYRFPAGVSALAALRQVQEGRTVVRRLTVPEGLTVAQVMALIDAAEGLEGPLPIGLREGSLLPETYHYSWGDTRQEMVSRMQRSMNAAVADAWGRRVTGLPLSDPQSLVTLASLIEKETSVEAERTRIAGVFVNRLRRNMRLQSDPTVVFAVTGGRGVLNRPITRADLDLRHPYNTYQVSGLPPGAIANPGRASLLAAAQPAVHDELYFVADGTGGHAFARTLADHNRNVDRWRQIERERGLRRD